MEKPSITFKKFNPVELLLKNSTPLNSNKKANNNAFKSPPGISKEKNINRTPPNKEDQFRGTAAAFNVGIVNKGNTCYINSVLQCVSVVPEFWENVSPSSRDQTNFFASFLKIMTLKTSKAPLDPSQFLHYLKQIVIKAVGAWIYSLF